MACGYVYSYLRFNIFREKDMIRLYLLHICVRPLVARSTNRAMREPQTVERATRRYYSLVSEADSTFTVRDAAILCQLFDEYWQGMNNEGNVLYYYLTGLYEYALPPLERYFKVLEENSASEGYLNRRIDEVAPRFRLLERCYEAMGFSERRDSLLASPIYKRAIKS